MNIQFLQKSKWVEWLMAIGAFLALLMACNNPVKVSPLANFNKDSTLNFNFKALPDNDYYRADSNGIYNVDIELYLRIFDHINSKSKVKLNFHSDHFGVFVINKDTLYPDDQNELSVQDFNNFRKNGQFYTFNIGKQNLDFEVEILKTKKKTKASFETK